MINIQEVHETNEMIEQEKLDVRTITMGISLLDCACDNVDELCNSIYAKITTRARDLVATGEAIEREFGIPIVNKRITVTPISLVGASACKTSEDFVKIAHTLDRAGKEVGVDLLGGYSALVNKAMTPAEELLIRSLPQALAETDIVCSSVNVGSTKTGIDMNAVELLGHIIKDIAHATADNDSYGCVKFVAFCNAPDDNPFMAGGFHGVTEGDAVINVGVSGPGVHSMRPSAAISNSYAKPLSAPRSKSHAWASWWRRRRVVAWACRLALSTCRLPPRPPKATRWARCSRKSAWPRWALRVPRRRLPC